MRQKNFLHNYIAVVSRYIILSLCWNLRVLTFYVEINDLALSTPHRIDSLTGISSWSCPVNALQNQATVGQNHTFNRVVLELFVLQKRPLSI